jgi:hypothetical protein
LCCLFNDDDDNNSTTIVIIIIINPANPLPFVRTPLPKRGVRRTGV